jgi:DNA-binding MarR family transcriptional regulator
MNTINNGAAPPTQPPIGFLLRKLDRLITERFERTLGVLGITRRQWQFLHTLAERSVSLDALSEAVAPFLDRDAGETAKQHIDPLTEQGVVRPNGDVYEITDRGRALFETLGREVQVTRDLTVAGLTDGEYERTLGSLQTMVNNLEKQA